VWREAAGGTEIVFDPLFKKGTPLPGLGEPALEVARGYEPAHNIGHFRYLECSHISPDGRPSGDVTIWDEILFPFDPALRGEFDLSRHTVHRFDRARGLEAAESYECDSAGAVTVTIANRTEGYHRSYRLGRWAAQTSLQPQKKRIRRGPAASAARNG
jgi:hypothetical protein